MSRGKPKNKNGDLEKEMKANLLLDLEILENNIHLELLNEKSAKEELELVELQLQNELKYIDETKIEEGKKINSENDSMRVTINNFTNQINNLEKLIRECDEEIINLENHIDDFKDQIKKELEVKDAMIADQRRQFEEMSMRFQHILQRTATKLQDRVDMGR